MRTTIEMAREASGDDWGLFQDYMPEIHRLVELVRADERARMAEQPAQQCRTDGRCQYAIDSGAEGMGHCPKGKCVMPAQQEPVGEVGEIDIDEDGQAFAWLALHKNVDIGDKLYTHPKPAQRTWVGLTDEERNSLWREIMGWGDPSHDDEDLMKAIEDASRRKNA